MRTRRERQLEAECYREELEAARRFTSDHRLALTIAMAALVVVAMITVIVLDGVWFWAALGVVVAEATALLIFVGTAGRGW